MTTATEIALDIFRISLYVPEFDLQFSRFLVRDEEPLLFRAGPRGMFPPLRRPCRRSPLDQPKILPTLHASIYAGDGATALHDFGTMLKEVLAT
jgi:hypothetical protein